MLVNNLSVSGGYQKLVIRFSQALAALGHTVTVYTPVVDKEKCYPDDINSLNIVTLSKNEAAQPLFAQYELLAEKIDPSLDAIVIHDDLSLLSLAALPADNHATIAWMLNNQLPENLGKYKAEVSHTWKHSGGGKKDRLHASHQTFERVRRMRKGLARIQIFATYDQFNKQLVEKQLGKRADFVAAGADLDRFKAYAKDRDYEPKKTYTLLSVGVVFPHRRYEDLIRSVAELRGKKYNVQATIVGLQDLSPDYFASLEKLTSELSLQKYIDFKHYVSDGEMTQLYRTSDAFIFINDGFTWGISVFEAVAAGLPVIITDNIGAADLVENGKTGWVVSPRSPSKVTKAVADLIDNRDKTKTIAQRAYKELTEFISWEAYTKRMLGLITAIKNHKS